MQKRKMMSPSDLKESVKKRKYNIARVQEIGESFIEAVDSLFQNGEDMDATIPLLSDGIVELALVSLLGLTGIEVLRFALHHVPDVLQNNKHFTFISKIMSSFPSWRLSAPETSNQSAGRKL